MCRRDNHRYSLTIRGIICCITASVLAGCPGFGPSLRPAPSGRAIVKPFTPEAESKGVVPECNIGVDGYLVVRLIPPCDVGAGQGWLTIEGSLPGRPTRTLVKERASTAQCASLAACLESVRLPPLDDGERLSVSYHCRCRNGGDDGGVGQCRWR